ncbi:hypothetical protein [Streptomyces sp. NPDC029554]|uniref:hypothetical protein n=1 Tax=Streptomyces sp. NPDC029554 TaxID=3155126 RepID=UPI0033C9A0EF
MRGHLQKKRASPQPLTARPPAPRTAAGWVLKRPETLTDLERLQLNTIRAHGPELNAQTRHIRSFVVMLTDHHGERVPD